MVKPPMTPPPPTKLGKNLNLGIYKNRMNPPPPWEIVFFKVKNMFFLFVDLNKTIITYHFLRLVQEGMEIEYSVNSRNHPE